jgi:hypothetical protein
MHKEAEIQLHEQRVMITSLEETLKVPLAEKGVFTAPAETILGLRSLQMSRMWLGEALMAINGGKPYEHSFNPENTTIEPQNDRGSVIALVDEDHATEIQFLKFMRKQILALCERLKSNLPLFTNNELYIIAVREAYVSLKKAQQWLGVALGEIRDQLEQDLPAPDPELPVDEPEQELDPTKVPPVEPPATPVLTVATTDNQPPVDKLEPATNSGTQDTLAFIHGAGGTLDINGSIPPAGESSSQPEPTA